VFDFWNTSKEKSCWPKCYDHTIGSVRPWLMIFCFFYFLSLWCCWRDNHLEEDIVKFGYMNILNYSLGYLLEHIIKIWWFWENIIGIWLTWVILLMNNHLYKSEKTNSHQKIVKIHQKNIMVICDKTSVLCRWPN